MNTNTTPTNSAQNADPSDKFAAVPTRFEDVRRLWKSIRSSLLDSFSAYSYFSKSLFKASKGLHSSFQFDKESPIGRLNLELLTSQAKITNLFDQAFEEATTTLNKQADAFDTKTGQILDETYKAILENLKQLSQARANYLKEKTVYEKAYKDVEIAIAEKKKPVADPLIYYNLTYKRRLKAAVTRAMATLQNAENQTQSSVDIYNTHKDTLNNALSQSMHSLKSILLELRKAMYECIEIHNQLLRELLLKGLHTFEGIDKTSALTQTEAEEMEAEQHYIENWKGPQDLTASVISSSSPKRSGSETKGTFFLILQEKLLKEDALDKVTDQEVQEYPDLVKQYYEKALGVFDERFKVVRSVREYFKDLAVLASGSEKTFSKLAKSAPGEICTTATTKQIAIIIDPFYECLGSFASGFQQLAAFANLKIPVLENIAKEQKESLETLQGAFPKSLKDFNAAKPKINYANIEIEKLNYKIEDISAKDPIDGKLPELRKELETLKWNRDEKLHGLKRSANAAAVSIKKIFDDYRTQDRVRIGELTKSISGLLGQEYLFFKSLVEALRTTETALGEPQGSEGHVVSILAADEGLSGYLHYIPGAKELSFAAKKELVLKSAPLVLQKLPPIIDEDSNNQEDSSTSQISQEVDEELLAKGGEEASLWGRFGLEAGEKALDNFTCAIEQGITRQGRLFIYKNTLCFSTVKLLGDIALAIPMEDIKKVEKKSVSLIFDTAMSVITKYGEIKFLSFFYRDKAYNLLIQQCKETIAIKEQMKMDISRNSIRTQELNQSVSRDDSLLKSPESSRNKEINEDETGPNNGLLLAEVNTPVKTRPVDSPAINLQKNNILPPEISVSHAEPILNTVTNSPGKDSTKDASTIEKENEGKTVQEIQDIEKLKEEKEKAEQEEAQRLKEQKEAREKEAKEAKERELKEMKELAKQIEERKPGILKLAIAEEPYNVVMIDETFNCTALDIYHALFSERKVVYKDKTYPNGWICMKSECGDIDIKPTKWTPECPWDSLDYAADPLEVMRCAAKSTEKSAREFNYTHHIKGGGPFVPKSCPVSEKHNAFWASDREWVVQTEVQTMKVPMSDCFVVRNNFRVKELAGGRTQIVWRFYVHFVKSTVFRGTIAKGSTSESTEFSKVIFLPVLKDTLDKFMREKRRALDAKRAKAEAELHAEAKRDAHALKVAREARENKIAEHIKMTSSQKIEEGAVTKQEVAEKKEENEQEPEQAKEPEQEQANTNSHKEEHENGAEGEIDDRISMNTGADEVDSLRFSTRRRDYGELFDRPISSTEASLKEEFGKFVKTAEQERVELKKEVSELRKIIYLMMIINCAVMLFFMIRG